jgi:anti-sigma factor RsiW
MRCSKALQQIHLYLDHQLTLNQVRDLEMHLSHCNSCQAELLLFQEMTHSLDGITFVVEPDDLTANIMRRVALSERQRNNPSFELLRPSLWELVAVIILATLTTLGVILGQPPLRAALPFTRNHALIWQIFATLSQMLMGVSSAILILVLWILGTMLGLWITWIAAGDEMRATWYKAMTDRLPVW